MGGWVPGQPLTGIMRRIELSSAERLSAFRVHFRSATSNRTSSSSRSVAETMASRRTAIVQKMPNIWGRRARSESGCDASGGPLSTSACPQRTLSPLDCVLVASKEMMVSVTSTWARV